MKTWEALRGRPAVPEEVWELFHENSKVGRYDVHVPDAHVIERMKRMHQPLPCEGRPAIPLDADFASLDEALGAVIERRRSARALKSSPISLSRIATILGAAYGVTIDNAGTDYSRPFRTVPSGGALYPLELFFLTSDTAEIPPGLYHYQAPTPQARCLRLGDARPEVGACLRQPDFAKNAALIVFITAVFERATFKYGARGYRFALLEAGHVAQNLNLACVSLGLGCLNIGGFYDREVDAFLGLDGISHSTLYVVSVGATL